MSDSQVASCPQSQDDSLTIPRDPDAQKNRVQTRRINSIEIEQVPRVKKDNSERDYLVVDKKVDLLPTSSVRKESTLNGSSYVRKEPGVLKDSISQNELKKPRKSESVREVKREDLVYKEERHAAFFPRRMIPRGSHGVPILTNIHDQYLSELLQERQKLAPFVSVLPTCSRLLNQEIQRITALVASSSLVPPLGNPSMSSLPNPDQQSDYKHPIPSDFNHYVIPDISRWNPMQSEQQMSPSPMSPSPSQMETHPSSPIPSSSSGYPRRSMRIDIPVDKYPGFNFVGRILGPRGNSLKRIESQTGCRVLIRGKGSIKDPVKEEGLRNKPGFEHLSDSLHVIVESDLPPDIVQERISEAVDIIESLLEPNEGLDTVRMEQLKELAIIKGKMREDTPPAAVRGNSPFNNPEIKRAKTRR